MLSGHIRSVAIAAALTIPRALAHDPSGTITGHVRAADGAPIDDAPVEIAEPELA